MPIDYNVLGINKLLCLPKAAAAWLSFLFSTRFTWKTLDNSDGSYLYLFTKNVNSRYQKFWYDFSQKSGNVTAYKCKLFLEISERIQSFVKNIALWLVQNCQSVGIEFVFSFDYPLILLPSIILQNCSVSFKSPYPPTLCAAHSTTAVSW